MPNRYLLLLLPLALLLGACTGLAGEPEIIATLGPPPTQANTMPDTQQSGSTIQTVSFAGNLPNVANGAAIYAENCTQCHAPNGNGQGELVQSGQVPQMPSFLDADYVRGVLPVDYFDIITNGNLQNLMPPWANALSVQERWDVAMYVYTLHYDDAQLALGEQIYERECAECHGAAGMGDGPEMQDTGREANDFTSLQASGYVDDDAWYVSVAEGVGEVMPAYADTLSEAEMRAVVAYSRTLGVNESAEAREGIAAPLEPAATAQPVPDTFSISGTVSNGTRDGSVPFDLPIELRFGGHDSGIQRVATTIQPDGSFGFGNIPYIEGSAYVAFTQYDGVIFPGDSLLAPQMLEAADGDYEITIYERTEDVFALTISDVQMGISPFTMDAPVVADDGSTIEGGLGDGLLVQQSFQINNTSDRAFLTDLGSGSAVSLPLQLPPGAVILNDPDNPRYIIAQQQQTIIDTRPIYPGDDHLIDVAFFLPYTNGAVLDQPLTAPLAGDITIRIAPRQLTLSGGGLTQTPDQAPEVNRYTASLQLNRDESIKFNIEGDITAFHRTENNRGLVTSDNLIPVLALFGLLLVVMVGLLFFWMRRDANNAQSEARKLAHRIGELDDMHADGQIDAESYQQERARLKQQLAALLAKQPNATTPDATDTRP